jgi:hypothetical protein
MKYLHEKEKKNKSDIREAKGSRSKGVRSAFDL